MPPLPGASLKRGITAGQRGGQDKVGSRSLPKPGNGRDRQPKLITKNSCYLPPRNLASVSTPGLRAWFNRPCPSPDPHSRRPRPVPPAVRLLLAEVAPSPRPAQVISPGSPHPTSRTPSGQVPGRRSRETQG